MTPLNQVGDEGPLPTGQTGGAATGDSGSRDDAISSLACTLRPLEGAVCLLVAGDLDLAGVPSFLGYLNRASDGGSDLIVDLSRLRYIDSSGINTLLAVHKTFARAGRRIVLAAVSPRMMRVLKIISVEQILPVYPTVEAALAGFRDAGQSAQRPT
jgi:stage II sporulation protein AA (anti-sigma F factor antagonist)